MFKKWVALNVNLLGHEMMVTKPASCNDWETEAYLKRFTGNQVSHGRVIRHLLVKNVDGEVR